MLHAPCILRLTSYLSFITPCFILHTSLITYYALLAVLRTCYSLRITSLLVTHYILHITPLHITHYTITPLHHYTLHLTPHTLHLRLQSRRLSVLHVHAPYFLRFTSYLPLITSYFTSHSLRRTYFAPRAYYFSPIASYF